MACLDLTNGDFTELAWSTASPFNAGDVTITRTPAQITIQRAGFAASLPLAGEFRYAVFGDEDYIALLRVQAAAGQITWTVSIVDITGAALGTTLLFSITMASTQPPPHLLRSPGNGSLAFLWSGTGTLNEIRNLMIVRSDDGSIVLPGPGTITGLSGSVGAQVTAAQLIMNHPSAFNNDTVGPRPQGSLTAVPGSQDFGEAVLGGADPTLATTTRTFTLRNDGNDCLTVTSISNDAPFTLTPASAALLPIVLDPGDTVDVDVVFAPLAAGNNIPGSLSIVRSPALGAATLTCTGDARLATAAITTSRNTISFGTIPHPGTATQTFTVSNTGEKNVDVTIVAPPAGSDFAWVPTGTLALPVGGAPTTVTVTFTTPGDAAAPGRTLTVTPSEGTARTVALSGAGCIANAVMVSPPAGPIAFGDVERGFRTVRFLTISNVGDGTLTFPARITAGADPSHAALFGLVLPGNDITDAPASRTYVVLPQSRCGPGAVGTNTVTVAVSFFADDAASATPYSARLEIDNPVTGVTTTFTLAGTIIPPVPVDAVLVLDRSGSMSDPIGARNKMEAALAAGRLFVQMLRDSAEDRAAIVRFNHDPDDLRSIVPVAGNRAALEAALTPANFTPDGATNIAGGIIVGEEEFSDPSHPSSPPGLKKAIIVLTDGMENRCFQRGGAGPWLSITGRDAGDTPSMHRPDGTPQDSDPLPAPAGVQVYGIGLGNPAQIDGAALDALSSATGASFDTVQELSGDDFFLLEKYFTQIFMETAGLAMISDPFFTINAGDRHEHEFDTFPGDVNAMIVLYDQPGARLPFILISPKGEEISGSALPPGFGLRHHSTETARFAEITFPKGEPDRYAGRWKVVVAHKGVVCSGDINLPEATPRTGKDEQRDDHGDEDHPRKAYQRIGRPGFLPLECREHGDAVNYGIAIGAGSNLRMQPYVEPGTLFLGDPMRLTAVVSEAGLPVTGSDVRVSVENPVGAQFTVVLRDDGLSGDGDADDGEYSRVFAQTSVAGVYRLRFRAEGHQGGRPYVREAYRTKTVYDRRTPPTVGDPDGNRSCCRKLLCLLSRIAGKELDQD